MRIGRETAAVDLHPEFLQLILGEPALHKRTGVDARRGMALDEQQVSAVLIGRGVKKVLEADVVERRRGLEARDMAAELRGLLVGAQDDRQGIPPDERPDAVVEDQLLRVQPVFLVGRDGVQVRRGGAVRDRYPLAAGLLDHLVKQKERAVGTLERHHRIKRIHPLAGLGRVKIFQHGDPFIDGANPCRAGAPAPSSSHQRRQSGICPKLGGVLFVGEVLIVGHNVQDDTAGSGKLHPRVVARRG